MALPADIVAAVAERLAERAGLELPAWVVEARAAARIEIAGCTPGAYVAWIDSARGAGELDALIETVRVGESRLFRHRSQIAALADVVAPALRARGRHAVRVWSAGCAAGEEPYTLAIVLARALPECAISIVATDVSAEALAEAEAARYPRGMLAHVPAAYRDAVRDDGPDAITIAPEIASLVRFERANLLDGAAPRACDLVWCRNVLIYFTAEARKRVVDRLVAATVPGGFVFVGYSESLRDVAELEPVRASDAVFYVRRAGAAARPEPPRARPPTQPLPRVELDDRTPPPIAFALAPPGDDTLALRGRPGAALVTAELSARLAQHGVRSLTVDLDAAELLDEDLAPVLRRARAAARTAGIVLVLRATRTGARRWIARHALDDEHAADRDPDRDPDRGEDRA
ncbi:MAG TPA: CheR family methyltransferase [Kofleriaceae bacterium]|nr:CheR family methyltransferase [Kofleriaceae bacterium]